MKCPFELPVKKTVTHVTEAGVRYQIQLTEGKRALAAYLNKEEADYIVHAINNYESMKEFIEETDNAESYREWCNCNKEAEKP